METLWIDHHHQQDPVCGECIWMQEPAALFLVDGEIRKGPWLEALTPEENREQEEDPQEIYSPYLEVDTGIVCWCCEQMEMEAEAESSYYEKHGSR